MTFLLVTVLIVSLQPRQEAEAPQIIAEPVRVAPAPPAPVPETEAPAEVLTVQAAVPEAVVTPAPPPKPVPRSIVVESQVTRADASLLELRQAVSSSQASHLLRQASSGGTPIDLRQLARTVLGDFGYAAGNGDRLHGMLVSALSNQKSDAYIDALLNTAVARGAFTPPDALILPTGRLDTQSLLQAMLIAARG
ncbi:MAG: hypothetical protein AAFN94_09990 [Pseudomonadota bacterium]